MDKKPEKVLYLLRRRKIFFTALVFAAATLAF
jgi:hypothetical protein